MTTSTLARWRARFGLIQGMPEAPGAPPLSLQQRVEIAREQMQRAARTHASPAPGLDEAVAATDRDVSEAVAMLLNSEDETEAELKVLAALEVIVAFDGSRPSFLIRDNVIDFDSSYATTAWRNELDATEALLGNVIRCTGRLELAGSHVGTAFLIAPTLIMTNRHVLQGIAGWDGAAWTLDDDIALDFGHEAGGITRFDRRRVTGVAFCGAEPIVDGTIIHDRLDMAVLQVSPSELKGDAAERFLTIGGLSPEEVEGFMPTVAVVGYPGDPNKAVPKELKLTYGGLLTALLGHGGHKRLAPGYAAAMADASPFHTNRWTLVHDASTVRGNSGSAVAAIGTGFVGATQGVAALHHGGDWTEGNRSNWAHLLDATRETPGVSGSTLAEVMSQAGID